ncbi:hypothetical protein V6N13_013753 [Hibiscus sabdariffa]|uniref:Uncharacterized protein n=2 Tax=Hibiscus sabdariffa TaxID=183260 RepID=A0ABR2BW43_9ROSI
MRLSSRADAGEELVSWNTVIAAYMQSNRFHEAFGLFNKSMWQAACMLRACTSLGALEQGEWTHGYIQNKRIELLCPLSIVLQIWYMNRTPNGVLWMVDLLRRAGLPTDRMPLSPDVGVLTRCSFWSMQHPWEYRVRRGDRHQSNRAGVGQQWTLYVIG